MSIINYQLIANDGDLDVPNAEVWSLLCIDIVAGLGNNGGGVIRSAAGGGIHCG